jgi:coenzyme F420-0:L-glutamate ligase/coenzyme F420-1:gamma-L-glutamate ligase
MQVIPLQGLPRVRKGDDLARLLVESGRIESGDVIVVAQKVVSKAEGRTAEVRSAEDKLGLALGEAVRVLRRRGSMVITETRHGLVCANSGVDLSNAEEGTAVLLPLDPDASARALLRQISHLTGASPLGVVISDTFGRPWRRGQVNVAIGVAGFEPLLDLRGARDWYGRELSVTEICVADEIASAAELVMGKSRGVPAAIVRGVEGIVWGSGAAAGIVRPPAEDLFR